MTRWLLQDAIVAPTRNVAIEQRIVRYLRGRVDRPTQRSTRAIVQALHHYASSAEIRGTLNAMKEVKVTGEDVHTQSGQKSDVWTLIEPAYVGTTINGPEGC